ncbi:MAG TPA: hypothetical protein VGS19_37180 [Streptosporangiaceae bacterium]|nr:hypothetical protein [Streptosporangiaceae bacterium]
MSGGDLIVAVPWLVFAAGLAVIGWRLAVGHGPRRARHPGPSGTGTRPGGCRADRPGNEAADRESAR